MIHTWIKQSENSMPALCLAVLVFHLFSSAPAWAQTGNTPVFTPTEDVGAVIHARAESETVLSVGDCVKQALLANDALQAERLRMAELQGQMKQALSTGLPTLDLVGDWSRSRNPAMALDSTFGGSGGAMSPPAVLLNGLMSG